MEVIPSMFVVEMQFRSISINQFNDYIVIHASSCKLSNRTTSSHNGQNASYPVKSDLCVQTASSTNQLNILFDSLLFVSYFDLVPSIQHTFDHDMTRSSAKDRWFTVRRARTETLDAIS